MNGKTIFENLAMTVKDCPDSTGQTLEVILERSNEVLITNHLTAYFTTLTPFKAGELAEILAEWSEKYKEIPVPINANEVQLDDALEYLQILVDENGRHQEELDEPTIDSVQYILGIFTSYIERNSPE